jgi:hypothetical protein
MQIGETFIARQFISKSTEPPLPASLNKVRAPSDGVLRDLQNQWTSKLPFSLKRTEYEQAAELVRLARILVTAASVQQVVARILRPTLKIIIIPLEFVPGNNVLSS